MIQFQHLEINFNISQVIIKYLQEILLQYTEMFEFLKHPGLKSRQITFLIKI